MNEHGQANPVAIFQYVVVLLVLGILLFALWPIISVFWMLNENVPGFPIAWSIMGLIPIIAIIGVTVLYLVTRPRQDYSGG